MRPGIEIYDINAAHLRLWAQVFKQGANVFRQVLGKGRKKNPSGKFPKQVFDAMHCDYSLACSCSAQDLDRAVGILGDDLALRRMQEDAPLRKTGLANLVKFFLIRGKGKFRL